MRTVNIRLQKDQSIVRLLDGLSARLGPKSFGVVDHWEGDLYAIGIARPDDHGVLVYLSTCGQPGGHCAVSLELPTQHGSDLPYTTAGNHHAANLDDLAEVVLRHFRYGRVA